MFYLILIILIILISCLFLFGNKSKLSHIPGPQGIPFLGNSLQLNPHAPRLTFMKWFEEYGAFYKVRLLTGDIVVLSGFDTIYEALVTKGRQFSGRPSGIRLNYVDEKKFALGPADAKWRALRMVAQRHIKQFGDGITSLENVIKDVADDMMNVFKSHCGVPFDPCETITKTSQNTIVIFIMGEKLSHHDPLMDKLTKLAEDRVFFMSPSGIGFLLIDMLPFLIHFPVKTSKMLKEFKQRETKIWEEIKQRQESSGDSLIKLMLQEVDSMGSGPTSKLQGITDADARLAAIQMLNAAVNTTSSSFYGLINALTHRQDIQEKLHKEVQTVMPNESDEPTLNLKVHLPYVRATLLETTRFFTILPGGVPHVATEDTELTGYGIIPKDTLVMTNLWGLHHDKAFWGDPEIFRPERFLDENGDCVLPDHPNRKHLMPFGAGTRVCAGEIFAQTRLFLWTVEMVHKFKICPAEGNEPSWLSPDVHDENLLLHLAAYQVKFESRF